MHPKEFIERHVRKLLLADGFSAEATHLACKEAVSHYEKSSGFRKGTVFSECLRVAKRMAKLVQKKQRQQAREDKKKGKVAA
ncbi:hypothetical protein SJR90_11715 [Aeromonas caviae]|uniref:hypothetical protein n=1 Tax=Aeromonas caviae TaxID=648 RepID=UPI0029DBD1B0|nr:hypothetical protein [Aeromonas caviae]MDX7783004.1 hypothetical protein [Aeromonas caviae]